MKKICMSLILFLFYFSPALLEQLHAQIIVVPNSLANSQGNSNNGFPFSCGPGSMRYQQVYLGSQFPQSALIDKISFRLNNLVGGIIFGFGPDVFPNIIIELSTTQAQPNALSATFADNVGPDVQTVYSGNLSLSAPDCDTQPCPFDVMIPLQIPFLFDPENGNLLLDVRVPVCQNIPNFDAADNFPTIISRAVGDINDDEADFLDTTGLVTQFRLLMPSQLITLTPVLALNSVGTEHTVTATLFTNGQPDPGELVTFEILSGPNSGEMSDPNSGECIPNDCMTDSNGQVSWSYVSNGRTGTDRIVASFIDVSESFQESEPVEKIWEPLPIPTISELGVIVITLLLGISGIVMLRKRYVGKPL